MECEQAQNVILQLWFGIELPQETVAAMEDHKGNCLGAQALDDAMARVWLSLVESLPGGHMVPTVDVERHQRPRK